MVDAPMNKFSNKDTHRVYKALDQRSKEKTEKLKILRSLVSELPRELAAL